VEKYGTVRQAKDDNTISMRFACWITKATNTHSIRNIYCFSTAITDVRTRLSVPFIFTVSYFICFIFAAKVIHHQSKWFGMFII